MSRKDYVAIAAIVARHVYDLNDAGIALVSDLADFLAADNERFDRDRFVDACVSGLSDAKREYVGSQFSIQNLSFSRFAGFDRGEHWNCKRCGTIHKPGDCDL